MDTEQMKREDTCAVAAMITEIPGMEARVAHRAVRHARLMQANEDRRGQSFKTRDIKLDPAE